MELILDLMNPKILHCFSLYFLQSLQSFLPHENWVCSTGQNKAVLYYSDTKNIVMKWIEITFTSVDYWEASLKWYYK